jgi:HKD family nuclease
MEIKLLGQGYESTSASSVGNQLTKFLSQNGFHSFTAISAFASEAGINGLSKYIELAKKNFKNITIITGVDQKGTSKEALNALLDLKINAFIFYQPSPTIFHPKIYLFEGAKRSELIIGSSNLTSQGLFTNVETSLHISINNSIKNEKEIVENLKSYFDKLFSLSDPNLKKLTIKLINQLVKVKIVPTEAERRLIQDKERLERNSIQNVITQIFPKRVGAKIPAEFRRNARNKREQRTIHKIGKLDEVSDGWVLLWESGPLTERDLNIPKGPNTNPTGSMLFKKGKLTDIDQRHYFRNNVFGTLPWSRDSKDSRSHLERTTASFQIIIKDKDFGNYKLVLTHNTRTNTQSYQQKNSMTSVSWGSATSVIAKKALIGKNASLYRKGNKGNEFVLQIK